MTPAPEKITTDQRIEQAQARRDARKASVSAAKKEQLAADLEKLDELEAEHGYEQVFSVPIANWDDTVPAGTPTMVIAKLPARIVYKRHNDQTAKAMLAKDGAGMLSAKELLGRSCIIYPSEHDQPDIYKAVMDITRSQILGSVGLQVQRRLEGNQEEAEKD